MDKILRLAPFIILLCSMNIKCKEENNPNTENQDGIYYREVNSSLSFTSGLSFKLDIDQDGTNDFEVYKDKYNTETDSLRGFFVKPLGDHKIILIKLTDNPLFNSMNVMSYNNNEVISESLAPEYSWGSQNGVLAIRHEPNPSFIARWSDGALKAMAFRLSLKGKIHYGWIKLQYSRENNSITIVSYAYNKITGGSITVDQR